MYLSIHLPIHISIYLSAQDSIFINLSPARLMAIFVDVWDIFVGLILVCFQPCMGDDDDDNDEV